MSRIIRIILYSVFFILIFLALSGIYEGCQENQLLTRKEMATANTNQSATPENGIDDIANEYFEDDEESSSTGSAQNEDESSNDESEFAEKIPDKEDNLKEAEQPAIKQESPREASPSSSAMGKYLVIAGNFSVRSNADEMESKLKKMGFEKAQVFQFDGNKFFTVRAADYSEISLARKASAELKQLGIDNYIHTKK